MIRRFTSAQFVPANAGAKAKNPVGSTLFSTPMVALLRHPGHKILRTSCHASARKRLTVVVVQTVGAAIVPGCVGNRGLSCRDMRRLRIFGQRDELKDDRSKGACVGGIKTK